MRLTFLAAAPLLLAACAGRYSAGDLASIRAANEFSCPPEKIAVQQLAPDTVRVAACGHIATYTCPAIDRKLMWYSEEQPGRYCIREAIPEQEQREQSVAVPPPPGS
jgi:hypothetical protein